MRDNRYTRTIQLSSKVDLCHSSKLFDTLKACFIVGVVILSACSSQKPVKPEVQSTEIKPERPEPVVQQQIDDQKFRQGVTALEQNNLDQAQRLFTEFSRLNPTLAGSYTNLALIQYKKGQPKKSLELLNKAIKLNPQQAPAYHLRAHIQIENREINKAENDYLKAIQLNPSYINAHYNLALLYDIYFQDIPLALKHYEIYMSLINHADETTKEWISHLKGTLKNG